jgi:hypothetical protein
MDHMRRMIAAWLLVLGTAACSSMNTGTPPPPPAAQPAGPQVFPVFFVGHSVALTPDGRAIVAKAAASAHDATMVQVAGPNTKVTKHYDPGLAQPRIDLIVNELISDGVPKGKIVRTSLPTDKVRTDTSGAQRVEIRILK